MRMSNISKYQGLGQFGPAYKVMLENDPHALGSIDRILTGNMIRLCPETVEFLYSEYTPTSSFYKKGSRPKLEQYVKEAISDTHSKEERIEAIARFTSSLQKKACEDLDLMQFGGTEEKIIARGSDWCSDIARVACTFCQIVGFPARIIHLFDTKKAYSGHVITEVYRAKVWGAVDPLRNVVYRHGSEGKPASTWDLMNKPRLIEYHPRGGLSWCAAVGQFRGAAISNYFLWRWREYDYTVSKINDYYRSILEMAKQGWPGGLRWLHRENG